jgi:beta-aspartyl-dipeptidase (metallo-type)
MFHLIKNACLYSPKPLGTGHILIAGDKIAYIGAQLPELGPGVEVEITDLDGAVVIPGLIDGHAHITGGGGESGPSSRVPPVFLSAFTRAGVTSVIGVLGTDDLTRNTETLVTQAYALREEGLSAWCHTGGYHLPLTTLTGSARGDIVFVDPIIGVGELALSDHRSSQPTLDELLRVASEAHVAGLMTGKAGIVHLHMGDGERKLSLLRDALEQSEIPARVFNPTHVNRNIPLFKEALALTRYGFRIDLTAFPEGHTDPGLSAGEAFLQYQAGEYPTELLTISSDGGGCLPAFDEEGKLTRMGIGRSDTLSDTLKQLINHGVAIEQILPSMTSNVADLLKLHAKGRLKQGKDADLVVLDEQLNVQHVMARGRWHIRDQKPIVYGSYENAL